MKQIFRIFVFLNLVLALDSYAGVAEASGIYSGFYQSAKSDTSTKSDENEVYYSKFKQVFEKIQTDYVKEPNKQQMIDAAIEGMLTSLDPHSGYFADDDLNLFLSNTTGEFGGIGIEIVYENSAIKVISPIDDLPSYKAGIKAGDYIVRVNDELVSNLGFNKALIELRGQPGTKVKVSIVREGESKPLEFELVREIVKVNAVKATFENNVAYLRIATFSEKVMQDVKKALANLEEQNKGKIKGIILDLRNNPGGLLDQGIAIVDYFLDKNDAKSFEGVIVSTKGRGEKVETDYRIDPSSEKAPRLPMIVLVNEGSASASEIVAAALQDYNRALLLGTKTYGKGSVQVVYPLDKRSAYKFTTALYYTPKGVSIQAEGINPDVIIEPAKVEYAKKDPNALRFSEATFKNHIKNEQNGEAGLGKDLGKDSAKDSDKGKSGKGSKNDKESIDKSGDKSSDKSKDKSGKNANKKQDNARSAKYMEDFVYARAYDLMQGIIILENKNDKNK